MLFPPERKRYIIWTLEVWTESIKLINNSSWSYKPCCWSTFQHSFFIIFLTTLKVILFKDLSITSWRVYYNEVHSSSPRIEVWTLLLILSGDPFDSGCLVTWCQPMGACIGLGGGFTIDWSVFSDQSLVGSHSVNNNFKLRRLLQKLIILTTPTKFQATFCTISACYFLRTIYTGDRHAKGDTIE